MSCANSLFYRNEIYDDIFRTNFYLIYMWISSKRALNSRANDVKFNRLSILIEYLVQY